MDSALEFTIVTSNRLVSTNGDGDREVGSHNICVNSGSDGLVSNLLCGRDNSSMGIGVAKVSSSSIRKSTITIYVRVSFPLADIVSDSRDSDGVLVDDGLSRGVSDEGGGAHSQRALAVLIDLRVESASSEKSRNFMDRSCQISVASGHGLVTTNSYGNSSASSNNSSPHHTGGHL
jgi:hypothetical protein